MKKLNGDGREPWTPPVSLRVKVQNYIDHYTAAVARTSDTLTYISGKTPRDYANERVQIWRDFAVQRGIVL